MALKISNLVSYLNNDFNPSLFFTQSYHMASEDMKYNAKSYGYILWCTTIQKFEISIIYIYVWTYTTIQSYLVYTLK